MITFTIIMITQTKNIDQIKPIFREYLKIVSQFYCIEHIEPWCEKAVKNLSIRTQKKEHKIIELKKENVIIGFAIINRHLRFAAHGLAISEFYIPKKHSRTGNGRRLAEHIFDKYPGPWEIAVDSHNHAAHHFWKKVVSRYTSDNFLEKQNQKFDGSGYLFNNTQLI